MIRIHYIKDFEYRGFAFLPYWKWKRYFKPRFGCVSNRVQDQIYQRICSTDRTRIGVYQSLTTQSMRGDN